MAAVLDDILSNTVSILQGVPFVAPPTGFPAMAAANIKRRMLPKYGETIDGIPGLLVAPGEDRAKPISFEGLMEVTYPVEYVILAAANRNYVTQLPTFLLWREQARKALLRFPLSGVDAVYRIDYQDSPIFDRSQLAQQYAYLSFVILFTTTETRN